MVLTQARGQAGEWATARHKSEQQGPEPIGDSERQNSEGDRTANIDKGIVTKTEPAVGEPGKQESGPNVTEIQRS